MQSVVLHLILESLYTADTHTEDNANAVLVKILGVDLAVVDSLCGSHKSQLCIAVHLAGFLTVDIFIDIKPLHLAGELGLEV